MDFIIIGHQRSGTTLLKSLLNSHEELYIPAESHFLLKFAKVGSDTAAKNFSKIINSEIRTKSWQGIQNLEEKVENHDLPSKVSAFFHLQAPPQKEHCLIGDKTPEYIDILDYLLELYPKAKFLFLLRDGREVTLSLEKRGWQGPFLENRAAYWKKGVKSIKDFCQRLPQDQSYFLKYEELVQNPFEVLNKVCLFLGVTPYLRQEDVKIEYSQNVTLNEKQLGIHSSLEKGEIVNRQKSHLFSVRETQYLNQLFYEEFKEFNYAGGQPLSLVDNFRFHLLNFLGKLILSLMPSALLPFLARMKKKIVKGRNFET